MAVITPFRERGAAQEADLNVELVRQLRDLAESEDIRLLFGDIFLALASAQPVENTTAHEDILRRLLAGEEISCGAQLFGLARKLDVLRTHDMRELFRAGLHKMAKAGRQSQAGDPGDQPPKPPTATIHA